MDSAEIDAFWVFGQAKKHQKTENARKLMLFEWSGMRISIKKTENARKLMLIGWSGKRRSIKTTRIHGN